MRLLHSINSLFEVFFHPDARVSWPHVQIHFHKASSQGAKPKCDTDTKSDWDSTNTGNYARANDRFRLTSKAVATVTSSQLPLFVLNHLRNVDMEVKGRWIHGMPLAARSRHDVNKPPRGASQSRAAQDQMKSPSRSSFHKCTSSS